MEKNWYDKIEAYVEGDLSALERKEMEAAMRDDSALAKEVRVWQLEQEALLQLRLKKVREQFAERSKHLFEQQTEPLRVIWYRAPWVRVAAAVVLLLVVVWWFVPKTQEDKHIATIQPKPTEITSPIPQHPEPAPPQINPDLKTDPELKKTPSTPPLPPKSTPLLASITSIPGSTTMGGGFDDPDSLLTKTEEIFHNKGSMDSCYQLIQAQEEAWKASPPDDNKVYLKLIVLKTLVLDGLGRQEEAKLFLQTYINDPTPRTDKELIWRDLPRLLQVLLQKPFDKAMAQKMLDDLRAQQDGSKYINFIGPFLKDLDAQLKGQ